MNKLFQFMVAFATATLVLTACEDVPEPYEIPTGGSVEEPVEGEYLNETFATNFGDFELHTPMGTPWVINYSSATATGYDNSSQTTTPSESYLVSPAVDLSGSEGAYLEFQYILRYATNYGSPKEGVANQVLITSHYTGDPATTEWTDITGTLTEGSDWNTWYSYSVNVPDQFIGQPDVRVALYYACRDNSATWEVRYLTMLEGQTDAQAPGDDDDDDEPLPEGQYINETFASDFGVFTASTPYGTPWIVNYSSANATGYNNSTQTTTPSRSYLVSPAINLSASTGAYVTFEYILRYATNYGTPKEGVENQVLITSHYTGDPTTTQWEDITGTLTEGTNWNTWYNYSRNIPTQYIGQQAVVVALHYACQDNSATWELRNFVMGEGQVEETPITPDEPQQPSGDLPSETFASGQGSFSIVDVNLGGMNYVWSHASSYSCMKASAYYSGSNNAAESWLVSPAFSLAGVQEPVLTFENAVNYLYDDALADHITLLVSTDYAGDGNVGAASWTAVDFAPLPETNNYFTFVTSTASLAAFAGQQSVHFAFRYVSTSACAPTWELKNLSVTDGGVQGGEQGGDTPGGGEVSGSSITISANDLGYTETTTLTDVGTLTLADGTTLTFANNGGRTAPAYYPTYGGSIRFYPGNVMTVSSTRQIASISISCNDNNTDYNASGDLEAQPGTVAANGSTVDISAINSTTMTLTNTSTTTGAPSQLRIKQMTITYAE